MMKYSSPSANLIVPSYEFAFSDKTQQVNFKSTISSNSKKFAQRYHFDRGNYERAFGIRLSLRLADLLDIACWVYLADRLASRRSHSRTELLWRNWKRNLSLCMPVRDLAFWQNPVISEQLSETLDYITEDNWKFAFKPVSSSHVAGKPYQSSLALEIPHQTCISLFSGGLDSFAGIVELLSRNQLARTYLVSAVTNRRMQGTQKKLAQFLKQELNLDIVHVPITLQLQDRVLPDHLEERSQRSRGFLFTVLGSVFAFHAGKNKLNLFENGVGAINLPMVDFQIGTDNSRATNPLALLETAKLLSKVFEVAFEIENLAQWSTKAELCRVLFNSPLREAIRDTVSCDGSFSRRIRRKRQCGLCTSCLLRRQSLVVAGLAEADCADDYQFDILRASSIREPNRLFSLRAMQRQVQKVKTQLRAQKPWLDLSRSYPTLEEMKLRLGGSSKPQMELIQQQILHLYSSYIQEWSIFESRIN